jgi:demethylmenaquinone methyltransferase/2-methoxy-6-polyprenyl-1,4-benzoquinol methylase
MTVLDVAGGTGDVASRIHARIHERINERIHERADERAGGEEEDGRIIVCDINRAMLAAGRDRALDRGIVHGIDWLCGDAEALPVADASVDAYTIAFGIRNVTRLDRALAEARRVLRPGGRFLCLEFGRVVVPGLAPLYDAYSFRMLPALGGLVARDRDAYRYLVESIRRFPDQARFSEMIAEAGFGARRHRNLAGGIAVLYSAWRV